MRLLSGVILSFIMVFLINQYFTKTSYDRLSGNGNPAIPLIVLLVVVLIFTAFYFNKVVTKTLNKKFLILLFLFTTLLLSLSFMNSSQKLISIKAALLKTFDRYEVEQVTDGITFFTNNVYINYLNLLTYFSLVSLLVLLFKQQKDKL